MASKKKSDIEALILRLLSEKTTISVEEVAKTAGLIKSNEGDRKAIRRALNSLVERGTLKAQGAARSRNYIQSANNLIIKTSTTCPESEEIKKPFKDISLSHEALTVLQYVSGPIQSRIPIGYNQDFLRLYEPNRTFYLNESQRAELLNIGRVENKARPAGTYARNILNRLLIDLSWNSSRLEGNTYSLLETKRLIELGENAAGKNASEAQMLLNHKAAIEYIIEFSAEEKIGSHEVFSIHALLSANLLGDPGALGRIRNIIVGIGGTTYMPLENPHVLKECFHLFIEKLNLIKNPFEQSFFSLIHLSYMQAFEDINKRTARLVANIPLIKENLRPLSFMDVDKEAYIKSLLGIYEKNDISLFRDLYLWAYKRSSQRYSAIQQAMGEPDLLKLKYRNLIQNIIRTVILEKVAGPHVVHRIQNLMTVQGLPKTDSEDLFKTIEIEISNLHDGNIARFRIRPSEFEAWKNKQ
jgi:DNA-binding Lrp family transcriptional regulator